jgi:type VI secretion system secreted protein VgrG
MAGSAAHHFRLDIDPLFQDLQVLSFTGTQAISEPFALELEVLIDDPWLDVPSLMYKAAFLSFKGRDCGIHGQVQGVMRSHFRPGPACYQLTIGPRLACLAQRYTPRIFQCMTATQIIRQVLREHGIRKHSYRFDLKAEPRLREYCAQYRETDLELVQRLCAEEGIHFHFQHSRQGHELVFGEGLRGFLRAPVANFKQALMQPGVVRFSTSTELDDQVDNSRTGGEGDSTLPFVAAGYLLPLKGHPDVALNHLWLVTRVVHQGFDPRQMEAATGHEPPMYINHFKVAPWEAGFKPRPQVRRYPASLHRAQIVGVEGEPVSRDAQGRVKALFDWVGQGHGAIHNYCWLPVSTQLSTRLLGGMQVMVSFESGDIDRPMIIGCVWSPNDLMSSGPIQPTSPEMIQVQLGLASVMGDEPWMQIDDGARITWEEGREMSFRVGDSQLTIDAAGVKLSSPKVLFVGGNANGNDENSN